MHILAIYKHKFNLHIHIIKHSNFLSHINFYCLLHVCRTEILLINIWFHAQNFIFVSCKHSCTHRPSSTWLKNYSHTLDLTFLKMRGYNHTYNLAFVWLRLRVREKGSIFLYEKFVVDQQCLIFVLFMSINLISTINNIHIMPW